MDILAKNTRSSSRFGGKLDLCVLQTRMRTQAEWKLLGNYTIFCLLGFPHWSLYQQETQEWLRRLEDVFRAYRKRVKFQFLVNRPFKAAFTANR